MPGHTGSCHCGAIQFEIDTVIERVTECNRCGLQNERPEALHFYVRNRAAEVGKLDAAA